MIRTTFGILLLLLLLSGCRTETLIIRETEVDNYIYGVDGETIYTSNVEKTLQKSSDQYLSILYANLFQTPIPANILASTGEIRLATGDKQLADELILNALVNGGAALIPSNQAMRADVEGFIEATYRRFFLRNPSPYELYELKVLIEGDPELTPELIYQAFALSNEYKFY